MRTNPIIETHYIGRFLYAFLIISVDSYYYWDTTIEESLDLNSVYLLCFDWVYIIEIVESFIIREEIYVRETIIQLLSLLRIYDTHDSHRVEP